MISSKPKNSVNITIFRSIFKAHNGVPIIPNNLVNAFVLIIMHSVIEPCNILGNFGESSTNSIHI